MTTAYTSASYMPRYSPENSFFQEDTRISHRAGFAYGSVVSVIDAAFDKLGVSYSVALNDGSTAWLRLQIESESVVRILFAPEAFTPTLNSPMLVPRLDSTTAFGFSESDTAVTMSWAGRAA